MNTHKSTKYFTDLLVAWAHVLLIALIVFVSGTSMAVRVVLFIVASVLLLVLMWPSDYNEPLPT